MTAPTEHDGILFGRIIIERRATEDDLIDFVEAVDAYGNDLGIAEALGMLRLAEHALLNPVDDEEDEEPC